MRFGCTLLSVADMNRSVRFYTEVLGLEIDNDFGANVILSGKIALQTESSWKCLTGNDDVKYGGNDAEVYFEEPDFDAFVARLRRTEGIRYVHMPVEHRWGQRVVRIYDPDMHIIEIAEDMRSVCRRFLDRGMNAEQISERMEVPMRYVRSCLASDTLETERLRLRPWRSTDADELYALASDPDIGPMAGWEPHTDADHSRSVIENILSKPGTFAITDRSTGRIVGCISLFFDKESTIKTDPADAEIGFWIAKDEWDKGYATEASARLLEYAFLEQGCAKVWCVCLEANIRCMRVQEKLGFLLRGTEDVYNTAYGTRCMNVSYLSRDRWRIMTGRPR